jgi:uncharacterized protein YprB with RNaseH-like and TPR domain
MGQNLRERLLRLKARPGEHLPAAPPAPAWWGEAFPGGIPPGLGPDWKQAGSLTLTRSVFPELPGEFPRALPRSLAILIPDFLPLLQPPEPQEQDSPGAVFWEPGDLLFFDLETTGLSGGTGTAAFLAAFGRWMSSGGTFRIDQYLLLDYPGEKDFIEALLGELQKPAPASGRVPLVVTYNGKSFDAQILKTRCLINGLAPPAFTHIDLLHPSRRLWKRLLPNCSQGEIETRVLGLDRTGDVPGALAPEIWFSFLKSGDAGALKGIADHNIGDIRGLASLFMLLTRIAREPLKSREHFLYDTEKLALRWRELTRRKDLPWEEGERVLGTALIGAAADRGHPQAAFAVALDCLNRGRFDEGRRLLRDLAGPDWPGDRAGACPVFPCSGELRAAAYRALAIDAEWRLRDREGALRYVEAALEEGGIRESLKQDLFRRRQRLTILEASYGGNKHDY